MSIKLTRTQEQILQLLLSKEEQLSIRGIARALKKSYTLTYNNIQALIKKGILEKQSIPPAQIVKIKENAPSRLIVEIEMKRTTTFLEKHPWIKLYLKDVLSTAPPFFIMVIFGSYAKQTQTKKSDLDILIITPKKEDFKELEQATEQYTNTKKSIIIIDAKAFTEMIKKPDELNVGNEARKNHIILYGAEQYNQLTK